MEKLSENLPRNRPLVGLIGLIKNSPCFKSKASLGGIKMKKLSVSVYLCYCLIAFKQKELYHIIN
jgi:hypothetical protein